MRERLHINNLSTRILCTVLLGIFLAAFTVTVIVIHISKNIFVDTYGQSQERVFRQIEKDLNDFHENMVKTISSIDNSWALKLYLNDESGDSILSFRTIYQMQQDIDDAVGTKMDDIGILILGMNGKSYLNRDENLTTGRTEILEDPITAQALASPGKLYYALREEGFTATTKDFKVVIGVQALVGLGSNQPYAVIYVMMKEEDLRTFYDFFVSETTDYYLLDKEQKVISSNQEECVGTKLDKGWLDMEDGKKRVTVREDGKQLSVLRAELPYFDFSMYGVIDNNVALENQYNIPQIMVLCAVIGLSVLIVISVMIRQMIRPLRSMSKKMSKIREGDFTQYMEVEGPTEVRELAVTYNYMLDDLKTYIDQLMKTQREKRKAEIKALQMQINPHYVYNTLASIKWLIWQGDAQKSTSTIDAFIKLLRNTISNTDEFITITQEIENLKNYVLINHTRYGDQVKVEYFVLPECETCLLPKMILQPFIENAFFHAFPSEQKGEIQVFVGKRGEDLKIQIIDDGVGMDQKQLGNLIGKDSKTDHFSGIGVNNVADRLKLLYGEYGDNYGVFFESEAGMGTTITVILPMQKRK